MQVFDFSQGQDYWYQEVVNPSEWKVKGKTSIKGAIFEADITQRVEKLRVIEENGYFVYLKGYLLRFMWKYGNFNLAFMI